MPFESTSIVMLNPESVMPNLFRHLFGAGLVQHLMVTDYGEARKGKKAEGSGQGSYLCMPHTFNMVWGIRKIYKPK
jgi:hypothetical protein